MERLASGDTALRGLFIDAGGGDNHVATVATHDGELVSVLNELNIPLLFCEDVVDGPLHFDFKWHEGPATTRTAMALLQSAARSMESWSWPCRRLSSSTGGNRKYGSNETQCGCPSSQDRSRILLEIRCCRP